MRVADLESIKIKLASPEEILNWSHGEVIKPETINYRTQRAEKDGLFCEKTFGPERDYQCYCGKYRGVKYKGITCDRCGVEVIKAGHYRSKIKLFKANDLEFKGRVQDFYGNKASALEYYSKALEFVPDHELANPAHDKVLKRLDKARMELRKIEKKLQIQDEDPRLWFKYGVVLLSLGKVDKAIECFDKVITLDSADPDAFARRGTAMESLGDYSGAKKYFEKALELKPNSMIAKRGLNYAGYFLEH